MQKIKILLYGFFKLYIKSYSVISISYLVFTTILKKNLITKNIYCKKKSNKTLTNETKITDSTQLITKYKSKTLTLILNYE